MVVVLFFVFNSGQVCLIETLFRSESVDVFNRAKSKSFTKQKLYFQNEETETDMETIRFGNGSGGTEALVKKAKKVIGDIYLDSGSYRRMRR